MGQRKSSDEGRVTVAGGALASILRGRASGQFPLVRIGVTVLVGGIMVLWAACANPRAPSGGPRDETPPTIASSRPAQDTVNVPTGTQSVRVDFSEYVERSSLPTSLSVTPTFEGRIQFDWSGRSVVIELPASLRDSTTYLFTFDTNLTDVHGVSLDQPLKLAFSTGPRINQGEIRGRVVGPGRGEPRAQVDVYAYPLPDSAEGAPTSLPERPDYRTQTGEKGTFSFEYMREQPYYVVALRDNNRNRQPDPSEAIAVPPRRALRATGNASQVPVPWLLARTDTVAPRVQGVQSRSEQRIRLTFSEPVRLSTRAPSAWVLRDSVAGAPVEVRSVYQVAGRRDVAVLRTAPMQERPHHLQLGSALVTDTLGHPLVADTVRFQASSQPDTTQTRFRAFLPTDLPADSTGARLLLPGMQPGVRFNQAPDSARLRRAITVEDTTGQSWTHSFVTEDGTNYRIQFDPPLQEGESAVVEVGPRGIANPDTTYRQQYRRVTNRSLGGLEGRVQIVDTSRTTPPPSQDGTSREGPSVPRPDSMEGDSAAVGSIQVDSVAREDLVRGDSVVVELRGESPSIPVERRTRVVAPGSTFVFDQLPDGTYQFRAYVDRNENGRWDEGRVQPYVAAEPVTWSSEPVEARPRWTSVLPAPLRIPVLPPASAVSADTSNAVPGSR